MVQTNCYEDRDQSRRQLQRPKKTFTHVRKRRNVIRKQFDKNENTDFSNYSSGQYAPIAVLLISLLMLIVLFVRWIILRCETKYIFPGAPVDYYHCLKQGSFRFLNTGGGLLHYSNVAHNNRRKLLFLHGNAGSLDIYNEILEHFDTVCGYDVYALEYYTYGLCWKKPKWSSIEKHISCILVENLIEAWSLMGDRKGIIVGFSLGGGLLGNCVNMLMPTPAQCVFVNTFCDLPKLVADICPMGLGRWIAPLMQTQWRTPVPKPWFRSKITIISTQDDQLIPRSHAQKHYDLFAHLNPQWIVLPDGGHALALIRWLHTITQSNILLPCEIARDTSRELQSGNDNDLCIGF